MISDDRAREIPFALTFDDVSLVPQYSEILPNQTSLQTAISDTVTLAVPLISATMDTVTEMTWHRHGAVRRVGHHSKNMTPQEQGQQVHKVKKFEAGIVAVRWQ